MNQCIPWDDLAQGYYAGLSVREVRPAKDARLVIGAVIIKHKLCLSDKEAVQQIQENRKNIMMIHRRDQGRQQPRKRNRNARAS
jgi:hypothetical protein